MTAVDVDTIEHLDFDAKLPCEHSKHEQFHEPDDPAAWRARSRCPVCAHGATYLLCDSGLRTFKVMHALVCRNCFHRMPWYEAVTILGPVR